MAPSCTNNCDYMQRTMEQWQSYYRRRHRHVMMFLLSMSSFQAFQFPTFVINVLSWRSCCHRHHPAIAILLLSWRRISSFSLLSSSPSRLHAPDVTCRHHLSAFHYCCHHHMRPNRASSLWSRLQTSSCCHRPIHHWLSTVVTSSPPLTLLYGILALETSGLRAE